jgi:hypothetical protein
MVKSAGAGRGTLRLPGMKIISPQVHGIMDYFAAVLMLNSPWFFQFADDATAAGIPLLLGYAMLIYNLLTKYEMGALPMIPFKAHLLLDTSSGVLLAAAPWLFGFAERVAWPHVALGLFAVLMTSATSYESQRRRRRTPGGSRASSLAPQVPSAPTNDRRQIETLPVPPPLPLLTSVSPLPPEASSFARRPMVENCRQELRTNVCGTERTLSMVVGAALVVSSLQSLRVAKPWVLLVGLSLFARGATGHCPLYYRMGRRLRGVHTASTLQSHQRPPRVSQDGALAPAQGRKPSFASASHAGGLR